MGYPAGVRAGDDTRLLNPRAIELWEQCIARLDDDDPRHILADELQADPDPEIAARGELMMLQLMPADPIAAIERRVRIAELVRRYREPWLGPLYARGRGASFERGFLARYELGERDHPGWRMPGDHDRELATIEAVLPSTFMTAGTPIQYAIELVSDLRLHSVRENGAVDGLSTFAAAWQPIRHVILDPEDTVFRLLEACKRKGTVRSLAMMRATYMAARSDPRHAAMIAQLDRIAIGGPIRTCLQLLHLVPPTQTIALSPRISLDDCDRRTPFDAKLELLPDGTARVSGEWLLQSLDVLRDLPARYTRLEIEDTSEPIVERIRDAVSVPISLRGLVGRAGNTRWA
ncbi:MAG TPA: hypothetical protein VGC41_05435 [Kofleriaceae bacterium]